MFIIFHLFLYHLLYLVPLLSVQKVTFIKKIKGSLATTLYRNRRYRYI
jgi:uncharacterized protein (DUF983 family)